MLTFYLCYYYYTTDVKGWGRGGDIATLQVIAWNIVHAIKLITEWSQSAPEQPLVTGCFPNLDD